MKSSSNFLLFQAFWLAAIGGAARGWLWLGPAALAVFLVVHLAMIPGPEQRLGELRYVLVVGVLGTLLDSGLKAAGIIVYPTSQDWRMAMVPPFIVSLWLGLGMLPRFSLSWLSGRPVSGAVLGALGGVLSFIAGSRFGVVGPGASTAVTWATLALEYALVVPLLMYLAPGSSRRAVATGGLRPLPRSCAVRPTRP